MFPLHRKTLPASKDELAHAIEEQLGCFVRKTGPIVDVRSRVFPYIDEIAINLDGAEINTSVPSRPTLAGASKAAFEVALINVRARNVRFRNMPLDLQLEARGILLDQAFDTNGEIVLLARKIRDGEISVSIAQLDLEKAIARVVAEQARAHGITVEQVRLAIRERGTRSIGAEVRVEARKFIRAKIDIYGQLDIDENFVAKIWQLRCQGGGAIGSRACRVLEPHLERFNGRSFALKSLPLGETQLHVLRLAVTDTVEIRVGFGSGEAQA